MYFTDRATAGRQLAEELKEYQGKDTIVVSLNEDSAVVAAQVALNLHAEMALFMTKNINLPNEADVMASLSSVGGFHYNTKLSSGQVDEITSEYRGYIDEQRIQKNHELNVLLGVSGTISKDMLRHKIVIVVADGVAEGFSLSTVGDYLRTVAIKKFVFATPIASIDAVDYMHTLADELHCLSVMGNYMGTSHYYDEDSKTTVQDAIKIMKNIDVGWRKDKPEETTTPPPSSKNKRQLLS